MGDVLVVHPRTVPLGEGDAFSAERVLPQRGLSLIGGWCFLDHFGPDAPPLRIASHPHTGLQTITWLFAGRVRHRDSLGTDVVVGPGEVSLMTAGRGITHTEYSDLAGGGTHGVQLWAALPDAHRFIEPHVEQFAPEPVRMGDHEVAIFVGEIGWEDSPVTVYSPLAAAEVRFASDDPLVIDVPPGWEYGVLADTEPVEVDGVVLQPGELAYLAPGRPTFSVHANASAGHVVRALLIGGEPLGEDVIVWWNFVGRTHDEIAAWRADYQAGLGDPTDGDPSRFTPTPAPDPDIPAPPLPPGRLMPRHRHPARV